MVRVSRPSDEHRRLAYLLGWQLHTFLRDLQYYWRAIEGTETETIPKPYPELETLEVQFEDFEEQLQQLPERSMVAYLYPEEDFDAYVRRWVYDQHEAILRAIGKCRLAFDKPRTGEAPKATPEQPEKTRAMARKKTGGRRTGGKGRRAVQPLLSPSHDLAYRSYQEGAEALERLNRRVTDDQVYAYLKEHGSKSYEGQQLPGLETWKRYVREGRKLLGSQKKKQGMHLPGRSTVSHREVGDSRSLEQRTKAKRAKREPQTKDEIAQQVFDILAGLLDPEQTNIFELHDKLREICQRHDIPAPSSDDLADAHMMAEWAKLVGRWKNL